MTQQQGKSVAKTEQNKLSNDEVKKLKPLDRIKYELTTRREELESYTRAFDIPIDNFIKMIVEVAHQNPELSDPKYEIGSWIIAAKNAARTGFVPDSLGQYAYIIPRRRNVGSYQKPQWIHNVYYQLGYMAIKKMMQEHVSVSHVVCEIVYENDEFSMVKMPKPILTHIPTHGAKGERKGAYAAVFYHDRMDNPEYVYMDLEQIESIMVKSEGIKKAYNQAKKDNKKFEVPEHSPWHPKNDPNGFMWLKCAIRALGKKEDLGERLDKALKMDVAVDAAYDEDENGVYVPVKGEHETKKAEARQEHQSEASQDSASKIMGDNAEDVDFEEMNQQMENEPSAEEIDKNREASKTK